MNVKKSTLKAIIKLITEGVLREVNAMQDDPNWGDEFSTDQSWVSRCCQQPALGELDKTDPENPVGICRGCQDHATFEPAVEEQGAGGGGAGAGGGGQAGAAGAGASGTTGASVTGKVSGYNSPGAFKRKKTLEDYPAARAGTAGFDPKNPNQRKPWRHIDSGFFEVSGKLATKLAGGKVPKHGYEKIVEAPKGFPSESGWVWLARTKTSDEAGSPRMVWSIRQALRDDPYVANKTKKSEAITPLSGMEEGKLEETTTSGDAGAYNVPGCFAKKGGSKLGIAGSEALGYTLTATGRKDMERSADKLLEGKSKSLGKPGQPICRFCHKPLHAVGSLECSHCGKAQPEVRSGEASHAKRFSTVKETAMGQLGPAFGAAQQRYDAQSPPEESEGPECPECGAQANMKDSGRSKGYWWWKAVCPQCGNKFGDDNF